MQIPQKIKQGDYVKTSTYRTINGIIDYLHTQRIIGDNKTISVSQMTNGVGLTVLSTPTANANISITHPFKMSVVSENEVKKLSVKSGYIYVNDGAVKFDYELFINALTLPTKTGKYAVMGYVQFQNNHWNGGIFYVPQNTTPYCKCGFHTFLIGKIQIDAENNVILTQNLFSELSIDDGSVRKPFVQHFFYSATQHNQQLTEIMPDSLMVNGGKFFDEIQTYQLQPISKNNNNTFCHTYIKYDADQKTAQLIWENTGTYPGYKEGNIYNILLIEGEKQVVDNHVVFEKFNYKNVAGYDESEENLYLGVNNGNLSFLKIEDGTTGTFDIESKNISVIEKDQRFTLGLEDKTGMFTISNGNMAKKLSGDGVVISTDSNFTVSSGNGLLQMDKNKTISYIANTENTDEYLSGNFTWQKIGKVKVNSYDPSADYLENKITSSDKSITLQSKDNKLDLKSESMVKVDQSDTPQYLENKLDLTSYVSDIFQWQVLEGASKKLRLSSKLSGYGVIIVQQGVFKFLPVPNFSKQYALTSNMGSLNWTQVGQCQEQ